MRDSEHMEIVNAVEKKPTKCAVVEQEEVKRIGQTPQTDSTGSKKDATDSI